MIRPYCHFTKKYILSQNILLNCSLHMKNLSKSGEVLKHSVFVLFFFVVYIYSVLLIRRNVMCKMQLKITLLKNESLLVIVLFYYPFLQGRQDLTHSVLSWPSTFFTIRYCFLVSLVD